MTTKLDKLKAERAAIETKLANRVATWKATDDVYRKLSTEHAYLVRCEQEELEKALGLRVGDKLELDAAYLALFNRSNPHNLKRTTGQWQPGCISKINIIQEGYRGISILWDGQGVGGIAPEDAQRMRALYLQNHPVCDKQQE